jgi:predicted XRE-type DNA-binding protein
VNYSIREVPGHPAYEVSSFGEVFTRRYGERGSKIGKSLHFLKRSLNNSGYQSVRIDGETKFVHALVLETFVGPCPEGMECRHLDGDGQNNYVDNLRWGTRFENVADKIRHGRTTRGERHANAKVTEADVKAIRWYYDQGVSQPRIAERFGVTQSAVSLIVLRKNWGHVLD